MQKDHGTSILSAEDAGFRLAFLQRFADLLPGVDLKSALSCAEAACEDGADPVEAAESEASYWREGG